MPFVPDISSKNNSGGFVPSQKSPMNVVLTGKNGIVNLPGVAAETQTQTKAKISAENEIKKQFDVESLKKINAIGKSYDSLTIPEIYNAFGGDLEKTKKFQDVIVGTLNKNNIPAKVSQENALQITDALDIYKSLSELPGTLSQVPEAQKGIFLGDVAQIPGISKIATSATQAIADLKKISQRYGRFMEGGVLRKDDEDKYFKIMPQLGESQSVRDYKIQSIMRDLATEYNNRLQSLVDAGYDVKDLKPMSVPEKPTIGPGFEIKIKEVDQAIKNKGSVRSLDDIENEIKSIDEQLKNLGLKNKK